MATIHRMTNERNGKSLRAQAADRARQKRQQRIEEARKREVDISRLVADVMVNRMAIDEARESAALSIAKLKAHGESQATIADLCEMTEAEVRASLALAKSLRHHDRPTGSGGHIAA